MGGVPVKHHSHSKVRRRRAHLKLKVKELRPCSNCNFLKPENQLCLNCGFYKGKPVLDVLAKLSKKERKNKEKELAAAKEEVQKE